MAQTSLPPGFRFHPTDVELVSYYLKRKIMGKKLFVEAIPVVELYKYAPWDLPDKSCLRSRDLEWYFFCPRDKKYTKGCRTNRATPNGYWKTTGKDRTIVLNSRIVGMKKTLIFHEGKVPKGDRTDWVMYEYKMEDNELEVADFAKDAYVLCKIFKKSGLGPKIGEQYGAPFNEEEWDDANAEAAMFPLMACPSSELADAVDESPVQHTVAASVVDEPPVLTAAAEGLPFEYNSTSTTAFDELQSYHTLESRGSEMASANNASDALNACNPPEFGGIVSNEWAGFLNDSPDCDGANEQLTELPAMPEAEAHALEINSDYLYNELARLLESEGAPTVRDQCPGYVNTEYFNPPMTSELGTGDNYLELNDLFPLGQTISSEMLVPHNLFPQYFSDQFPYNQLNYPHYENDGALAASLAAGNLLPSIPSMHDMSVHDTTFTTNLMGNNGSNPTVRYPFS